MVALEQLRVLLRGRALATQLALIESMVTTAPPRSNTGYRVLTMQSITARIRFLWQPARGHRSRAGPSDPRTPGRSALLAEPGVGPVIAAQLLINWAHLDGSEAANTPGHRLNRGDRALTRSRCHAEARAYGAREPF